MLYSRHFCEKTLIFDRRVVTFDLLDSPGAPQGNQKIGFVKVHVWKCIFDACHTEAELASRNLDWSSGGPRCEK